MNGTSALLEGKGELAFSLSALPTSVYGFLLAQLELRHHLKKSKLFHCSWWIFLTELLQNFVSMCC